jgi:hypothetical protein
MRQNNLLCAQSRVGAEPINAVQIGGYACASSVVAVAERDGHSGSRAA